MTSPPITFIVLTDAQATRDNILLALSRIANTQRVTREDRVLIYFSGHGQTVSLPDGGAKGFLIPFDADIQLNDLAKPRAVPGHLPADEHDLGNAGSVSRQARFAHRRRLLQWSVGEVASG